MASMETRGGDGDKVALTVTVTCLWGRGGDRCKIFYHVSFCSLVASRLCSWRFLSCEHFVLRKFSDWRR